MPPPPANRLLYRAPNDTRTGPPSLVELCQRSLIRNIDYVNDVGTLRFELVKPIISRVKSAKILREIEENSPQVAGKQPELWKEFIRRDFGIDPNNHIPKNPKDWPKVHRRLKKQNDVAEAAAAAELKARFDALNADKQAVKLQYDTSMPKFKSGTWYKSQRLNHTGAVGSKTRDFFKKVNRERNAGLTKKTVPTHLLKARTPVSKELIQKLRGPESEAGPSRSEVRRGLPPPPPRRNAAAAESALRRPMVRPASAHNTALRQPPVKADSVSYSTSRQLTARPATTAQAYARPSAAAVNTSPTFGSNKSLSSMEASPKVGTKRPASSIEASPDVKRVKSTASRPMVPSNSRTATKSTASAAGRIGYRDGASYVQRR